MAHYKAAVSKSSIQAYVLIGEAINALRRVNELLLLLALTAIYLVIYLLDLKTINGFMNIAGPSALAAILGWSAFEIARSSALAIWAPLFWLRIASAAYFGFGALVPHVVSQDARRIISSLYPFDDQLNLKINLIYCSSILALLSFSYVFLGISRNVKLIARSSGQTMFFAWAFLLVGGVLRYGFILPHSFGMSDAVIPGAIRTIANTYYVGIYLLVSHSFGRKRWAFSLAVALAMIEVVISVASFAKIQLMLILIFFVLGLLSRGISRKSLIAAGTLVFLAYLAFQPLVSFGRDQITMKYGEIRGASIGERLDIIQMYMTGRRTDSLITSQAGLSRLSYVNVGAFVVDRHDSGRAGDTLRDAPAILIPRFMWADKPIITGLGTDLYSMVRGREGSALSVGLFAEAYWNFGWGGILPLMALLAAIFATFTRFSLRVMANKDWLQFPVVFIGVIAGIRVDGYLVPDILGPAWIAVCLGALLAFARSLTRTST